MFMVILDIQVPFIAETNWKTVIVEGIDWGY